MCIYENDQSDTWVKLLRQFMRPGFLQYWLVSSQGFHVRNSVFFSAYLQLGGICTLKQDLKTRHYLRWRRDMHLLFPPSGHLYGGKTESKGSMSHGSISASLKIGHLFLKTWVLIISTSSHQAMLVRNTLLLSSEYMKLAHQLYRGAIC